MTYRVYVNGVHVGDAEQVSVDYARPPEPKTADLDASRRGTLPERDEPYNIRFSGLVPEINHSISCAYPGEISADGTRCTWCGGRQVLWLDEE